MESQISLINILKSKGPNDDDDDDDNNNNNNNNNNNTLLQSNITLEYFLHWFACYRYEIGKLCNRNSKMHQWNIDYREYIHSVVDPGLEVRSCGNAVYYFTISVLST
jgi:hypothetical protein